MRVSRWQAAAATVVAVFLYMRLPPKLTFGPVWIAPLLVAALLLPLILFGARLKVTVQRALSVSLVAVLNFFNVVSIILLVVDLLDAKSVHHSLTALDLLRTGGLIWLTNVIVFALWFWEIDRESGVPDFLFPQTTLAQSNPACVPADWQPLFVDYLYLSFTNALAFSPTDVMPLTRIAKMLMLVESLISFATVALILARSVNILS